MACKYLPLHADLSGYSQPSALVGFGTPVQVMSFEKFIKVFYNGSNIDVKILSLTADDLYQKLPKEKKIDTSREVLSPMPGKVTNILVKENDKVEIGDNLVILDAMKMENILKADKDAVIKKINIKEGDTVSVDQELIVFS